MIVRHLGGIRGAARAIPRSPRCSNLIRIVYLGHRLRGSSPTEHANRRNLNHSPKPDQSRRNESLRSRRPLVSKSPSGSHQRRLDLTTIHGSEPQVNSYPANEQEIWEVERGRITNAVLPMPPGKSLSAGDSILFALAYSPVGQETCYVKGEHSICVLLTDVTDLGAIDPATGKALFRLSWKPPGQSDPPAPIAKRDVKSRGSHWRG